MANRKISEFTALTAPASGDVFAVLDVSASGAEVNKKITYANVLGKAKAQISKLQKPRVDHIHPPADPVSNAGAAQVAQSSSDAAAASTEPAPGIPDFDAGMMRSQSKIRTLGVSV